jgi:hypothetical protein
MTALQEEVQTPPLGHGEAPPNASTILQASFAAFRSKCEQAISAKKTKHSSSKKTKKDEPLDQVRKWCTSMSRVQRYFGLLPAERRAVVPTSGTTWDGQVEYVEAQPPGSSLDALKLDESAPFAFDQMPVFISIDIEAWERDHHIITEVGISTLDTQDLAGRAPGKNGSAWRSQIRSRHFRLNEFTHFRNRQFCVGDPASFQFGKSEFVPNSEIGGRIDACFEWPFSVQYKHDGDLKKQWAEWKAMAGKVTSGTPENTNGSASTEDATTQQPGPKVRTIILVGHNLKADLEYLAQLGSEIFSLKTSTAVHEEIGEASSRGTEGLKSIKEALDTATLYKNLMKDDQPKKLATVLESLKIDAYYLHNAGNDARYTLEALVALAVKARLERDEVKNNGVGNGVENVVAIDDDAEDSIW